MTPTKIISALTLALLMTAGVASAETIPADSQAAAATTMNTTQTTITRVNAIINDNAFDPHNLVVSPGTTVTWTNHGMTIHSIVAERGSFSSGPIPAGGTYSQVFNDPGTYVYYDPAFGSMGGKGMFGIVVVLPAGTSASTGTPGVPNTGTGGTPSCTNCTPGVPNTGNGGNAAANALMLALSGLVVMGGALVLRKRLS
jgi:plastocyanin